jgi:hypothetical protein
MKNSDDFEKIEENESLRVDYSNVPKKIKEEVEEKPFSHRSKSVSVTWDGKQYIIRIPTKIAQGMNITKESKFQFDMVIAKPETKEENTLTISLVNKNESKTAREENTDSSILCTDETDNK